MGVGFAGVAGAGVKFAGALEPLDGILLFGLFLVGVADGQGGVGRDLLRAQRLVIQRQCLRVFLQFSMALGHLEVGLWVAVGLAVGLDGQLQSVGVLVNAANVPIPSADLRRGDCDQFPVNLDGLVVLTRVRVNPADISVVDPQ